ncbi:hypothetical protein ACFV1A_12335 [Streptomyces seoulensis]|uniref:Membrane-bound hydrophilic protein n=1 Tax=Streptomyces seoulensis TaxID=73044 RepID=A0A4P6TY15_STRSO|nr:hypothetical protein [Streptomyces seoulensis]QBJ92390.1 hypothetical protein D0Z67_20230 [Streptomyces seoulensis]
MPADEVTHGPDVDGSRARTGPRHAAPKKLLFTRLHMPAGKAIASVAMPTAVLMGMGFTSTLAIADSGGGTPASNSQKAADYKNCVEALGGKVDDTSASPSPSAAESTGTAKPSPSASAGDKAGNADEGDGKTSSPDSGSGDDGKDGKTADGSSSAASKPQAAQPPAAKDTPSAPASSPAASKSADGGLLGTIGDALGDVLTGGKKAGTPSATPTPSATGSTPSATSTPAPSATSSAPARGDEDKQAGKTDPTAGAKSSAKAGEKAEETPEPSTSASASPSPSASASDAAKGCEKATDDVGGVDNKQLLADDPWYLNASSLLLKGADYQGVVQVRTANGTVKKVLKYVISGGTDIGDLHQTVKDKASGKTYHVQAGKGTTSTIRDGDTTMYTESISGKLFGLIPITFSPDSPPPLNIPLIYFTDVTVQQAAQFGGTLTIPKLHQYAD